MLELLILKTNEDKKVILLEDGKIIELFDEDKIENKTEGNIYIGIVKDIIEGMGSAFLDIGTEKNGYIQVTDLLPKVDEVKVKKLTPKDISIKNIIKREDKILVQVKKDSNELKGARISTHINIPSKYIALMPNTDIITVSQKIEDKNEQERLKKLVKNNISPNNGAIIRTSAKGKTQEIIDDIKKVESIWSNIESQFNSYKSNKPKLIYKSEDIAQKMLTDLSNKNIEKIISNDKNELEKIKSFTLNQKEYSKIKYEVKQIEEIEQIYNIERQIEKNTKRKIWLKCGGFITIDKTEALTAIDVNTGKFIDGKDLYDTVFTANLQATKEIAKQIRLRDIGGIIIIDYIDMLREGDKQKIEEILKECLKSDRAKTQVEGFTKLDLMELTRKQICSHKS